MISENYKVFGWSMVHRSFSDAEEYDVTIPKDLRGENLTNWVFWVKGGRTFIEYPDGQYDDVFIKPRTQFVNKTAFAGSVWKAGSYKMKMIDDGEFWCLDYRFNKDSPELEGILLTAGQTYTATKGSLIFVAMGETSIGTSPLPVEISSEVKIITAITDAALITFSKRK
jgi:hypothetical protein